MQPLSHGTQKILPFFYLWAYKLFWQKKNNFTTIHPTEIFCFVVNVFSKSQPFQLNTIQFSIFYTRQSGFLIAPQPAIAARTKKRQKTKTTGATNLFQSSQSRSFMLSSNSLLIFYQTDIVIEMSLLVCYIPTIWLNVNLMCSL